MLIIIRLIILPQGLRQVPISVCSLVIYFPCFQ